MADYSLLDPNMYQSLTGLSIGSPFSLMSPQPRGLEALRIPGLSGYSQKLQDKLGFGGGGDRASQILDMISGLAGKKSGAMSGALGGAQAGLQFGGGNPWAALAGGAGGALLGRPGAGAASGAMSGATLGSMIPGPGTAIGAGVGGLMGLMQGKSSGRPQQMGGVPVSPISMDLSGY